MKTIVRFVFVLSAAWAAFSLHSAADGPYLATGIKIGEVTSDSAIVWARLTRDANAVPSNGPVPEIIYVGPNGEREKLTSQGKHDWSPEVTFPDGATISTLSGAARGTEGDVRVRYKPAERTEWVETPWRPVDPDRSFATQIALKNLKSNTKYDIEVESRNFSDAGETVNGGFVTAPAPDTPAKVTFMVSTGQEYKHQDAPGGGFKIYDQILKLDPSFFVHTGDIVYYDALAKNAALARWHWERMYSLPTNVRFHRQVASYFEKDDHETWQNDCWPTMQSKYMGELTFAQGQAIFLEQVPMGEKTYRTYRWGKDLQIWLMEGRDFRSSNDDPDGPAKTIWGAEQKAWFKKTVAESDATFRVLISPTPIIGPDRGTKNDNLSNAGFRHEGDEIRQFISAQKNMISICGDRHWQYVSVDPKTKVWEFSCGPASNEHAGGWEKGDKYPEHRYLNVIGGFLAVTVDRESDNPLMVLRHYSVDGAIMHEERIAGK
jgi:alkaline phosphatase D